MRTHSRLFRFTSSVALTALLTAPLLPAPTWAQTAPPPPAGTPAPDAQTQADPPARIGRLAQITGTVSFHNPDDTTWSPATPNYPVTSGNSFWTQPGAQAVLEFGDSKIVMDASTELDLGTLDTNGLTATVPQGEVFVHVRGLNPGETITLQTPRGTATITAPGDYGVAAGDTADPTVVTTLSGTAQVSGAGQTLTVGPGQAATIMGAENFQASLGPAPQDAFLSEMVPQTAPPPAQAPGTAAPAAVAALPGGDDLDTTGTWATAPDYGQVWYPPVAIGWVPYRDGHWAYIPPWGWTWVDDAPWGFAPFHYGRWAYIRDRWGWVPGLEVGVAVPVYAPALVTFFGIGVGVGLAIGGNIGWCPLGPGEAFHPWYHASPGYIRGVNPHITNITTVNNIAINNFRNGRFATVAPAAALTDSRPISRSLVPVSAQQLAAAHPTFGRDPVRPTTATAGITPAVARQFHVATNPGTAPRAAPGPAVHPVTPTAAGRPAAVPLRPAGSRPAAARPVGPATAPHPGGAPGPAFHPRTSVTPAAPELHPAEAPRPSTAARPAETARPAGTARPAATPRPAETPRAGPAPAATQPHNQAAAHPAETPHPAVAPHPAEAPRPAAGAPRPVERPRAPTPASIPHPPAPRPEPRPAPRPAPAARPAPRPAPAQHEERRPGEK